MLVRDKASYFILVITCFASLMGLFVNVYGYVNSSVFAPFSAILCLMGLYASFAIYKAWVYGHYLVILFWLCQIFVVGVGGQKYGFVFSLAISVHFNITSTNYVVINLLGIALALLSLFKLKKLSPIS